MTIVLLILHSAAFHGALTGAATAAGVDYHNFQTWKRWQDALTYDWGTATFRWFSGACGGAILGAGLGAWLS